ncbi:response regulator [Pokkaliibacter sp. CJK22405]|uniref:response regulator n=1 Tax=Pokkaliibacter sp. CJK22405 TaxID=3384615 RepID=UPI0039850E75
MASQPDFSRKRFLVIDDLVEARSMVRETLKDAGAVNVDVAMSANAAMEYLRTRRYDLILSDYNLGRGKDGQQILEEARLNELIPHTAAFIMITAETSPEMVMGALEYQPDGYITKPFTRAELKKRLLRMMTQKEQLKPLNLLLDEKDHHAALDCCEAMLETLPALSGKLLRIRGELLIELQQYDDARRFYALQLKERQMPWALYGLARACFFMQDYDKASEYLDKLMLDNQYFVRADDLMANVMEQRGNLAEAETILIKAIEKSPKAVLRQMALARIATMNQHWPIAEQASKRAIILANHSVYRTADNYLTFIDAVVQQAESGARPDRTTLNQVDEALSTLSNDFDEVRTDDRTRLSQRYYALFPERHAKPAKGQAHA